MNSRAYNTDSVPRRRSRSVGRCAEPVLTGNLNILLAVEDNEPNAKSYRDIENAVILSVTRCEERKRGSGCIPKTAVGGGDVIRHVPDGGGRI